VPDGQNGKRRRVTAYIPEDEFAEEKRKVDIITVSDMQQQYSLVLSRLQLSGQMQDMLENGEIRASYLHRVS
jgi:nuclear pore complex protein Nup160